MSLLFINKVTYVYFFQLQEKVKPPNAEANLPPPPLPSQGPNASFSYGVPFSNNIPPLVNDNAGPGNDMGMKPLNTNLEVCILFNLLTFTANFMAKFSSYSSFPRCGSYPVCAPKVLVY